MSKNTQYIMYRLNYFKVLLGEISFKAVFLCSSVRWHILAYQQLMHTPLEAVFLVEVGVVQWPTPQQCRLSVSKKHSLITYITKFLCPLYLCIVICQANCIISLAVNKSNEVNATARIRFPTVCVSQPPEEAIHVEGWDFGMG